MLSRQRLWHIRAIVTPSILARSYHAAEKYRPQLERKAKEEGTTVEKLFDQYKEQRAAAQKAFRYDPHNLTEKFDSLEKRPDRMRDVDAGAAGPSGTAPANSLASFVDVQKLRLHEREEIEMIWRARFVDKKQEFCATIKPGQFSKLYVNARKYPVFVLPLPHENEGAELHYVQWSFENKLTLICWMTSLAEYKLHSEYAPPHTAVMLHTDLVEEKQIVLENTTLLRNTVSRDNAVFLTWLLHQFYFADSSTPNGAEKLSLLRDFNSGDASFTTDRLLSAAEKFD